MSIEKNNIFDLQANISRHEIFDSIAETDDILIERIVSTGQKTPEGQWLEEDTDEWVMLLEGNALLKFENDTEVELSKGDHIMIPANTKHRIETTSSQPACIWLAIHGKLTK